MEELNRQQMFTVSLNKLGFPVALVYGGWSSRALGPTGISKPTGRTIGESIPPIRVDPRRPVRPIPWAIRSRSGGASSEALTTPGSRPPTLKQSHGARLDPRAAVTVLARDSIGMICGQPTAAEPQSVVGWRRNDACIVRPADRHGPRGGPRRDQSRPYPTQRVLGGLMRTRRRDPTKEESKRECGLIIRHDLIELRGLIPVPRR